MGRVRRLPGLVLSRADSFRSSRRAWGFVGNEVIDSADTPDVHSCVALEIYRVGHRITDAGFPLRRPEILAP
jgi:hypothetical protein